MKISANTYSRIFVLGCVCSIIKFTSHIKPNYIKRITSSLITVALLSERSAAVILRPKSASTILLNSFETDQYRLICELQ